MVFLQLKGEYKVVKTLRGLSGFGWDEGDQMVTAPLAVWDSYVKVVSRALQCNVSDIDSCIYSLMRRLGSSSKSRSPSMRKLRSCVMLSLRRGLGHSGVLWAQMRGWVSGMHMG